MLMGYPVSIRYMLVSCGPPNARSRARFQERPSAVHGRRRLKDAVQLEGVGAIAAGVTLLRAWLARVVVSGLFERLDFGPRQDGSGGVRNPAEQRAAGLLGRRRCGERKAPTTSKMRKVNSDLLKAVEDTNTLRSARQGFRRPLSLLEDDQLHRRRR